MPRGSGSSSRSRTAKLRWARVVQPRQVGTRVLYSLIDEHARELVHQAVLQAEHTVDLWPHHHHRTGPADREHLETV